MTTWSPAARARALARRYGAKRKRAPLGWREAQPPPNLVPGEKLDGPPPCFGFRKCARRAEMEKGGRAVCRECAAKMRGAEYPLRKPGRDSLAASILLEIDSLEMIE